jgi:DNA-damage-inducible protein J
MGSLTLNIRVDVNDKKNFEQFCSSVGMNVSTAVNMFIKAVLREQKLPFEIKTNTFDETVYEKLKEAELEMTNTSKRYTMEEVIDSMNNIIDKG